MQLRADSGERMSYPDFWEAYCRNSGVFCGMGYLFGDDEDFDYEGD